MAKKIVENNDPKKYVFLNGSTVSLSELSSEDVAWLLWFMHKAWTGTSFVNLKSLMASPNAYPLKGGSMVTRQVFDSVLYRIADDIAARAGIYAGKVGKNPDDII